jgi:hypothetical protein
MVTLRGALWTRSSFFSDFHYYNSWVHVLFSVMQHTHINKSPHSTILYPDRLIWIYFWSMDGCYHILFCSFDRRVRSIYRLSRSYPRIYRTLASFLHINQTRRSCHRKATQAALPNPTSTLSLQCYELSFGSVTYSDTSHLHGLHGPLLVQSDYPYQSGSIHPFFQRLSR